MTQAVINSSEEQVEKMPKKISEQHVLDLLFKQVEKPKKYFKIKVVNVYDNSFRINIWGEFEKDNLLKRKIIYSYFVKVVDESLNIVQGS
jgi:hypothetical protein